MTKAAQQAKENAHECTFSSRREQVDTIRAGLVNQTNRRFTHFPNETGRKEKCQLKRDKTTKRGFNKKTLLFPSTCALYPFAFSVSNYYFFSLPEPGLLSCPDKTQIPVVYTKARPLPRLHPWHAKCFLPALPHFSWKRPRAHNWKQAHCVPCESQ